MKIKSFLFAFFVFLISCSAYSQDNAKTAKHHHTAMAHHKHHKHLMKEGSKADKKEDKKEAMEKKSKTEKKVDKK